MQKFILRTQDIQQRASRAVVNVDPFGPLMEVTIKEYRKDRSLEQNAYLWAMHQAASEELGYTAGEMHVYCCRESLGTRMVLGQEEVVTTTCGWDGEKLNVADIAKFITEVEAMYISLGIRLDRIDGREEKTTGQSGPA